MSEHWSSRLAFILAAIGSAVGVGNIWRFPYLVGESGGGNFVIPYIFLVFLFGFSAMLLEFISGSSIKKSALAAFRSLSKKYHHFTYIPFLISFIILTYYIVISGWTLFYLVQSLFQSIPDFNEFISSEKPFMYTFLVALIMYGILHLKVKEGLETANKYLTPLLFLCLLVLLVNSFYLFDLSSALKFYSTYDLSKMLSVQNLVAVFSQIIFSLGVGYGIMFTYASYSRDKNIFGSALAVTVADTLAALISGLIVFSIVFSTSVDPASGPTLVFQVLPSAFSEIAFGALLMPIFFFLLFSAALTSALSMNELLITNLEDQFKVKREKASLYSILLIFLFSIPSAFTYHPNGIKIVGSAFLDFLDGVLVEQFSPLAVFITITYLAWFYKDLPKKAELFLPKFFVPLFLFMVKFAIPAILGGIFLLQFF